MTEQERSDAIQGFRDLANFFEAHPSLPVPTYNMLVVKADTREELAKIARTCSWEKDYQGEYFSLKKQFKGPLTLDYYINRTEVCRRVVVGTEVLPAQPEREVEKVEWVCDDASLLAVR